MSSKQDAPRRKKQTLVIDRAKEILGNLEEGELGETGQPKIAKRRRAKPKIHPDQLDLFGSGA